MKKTLIIILISALIGLLFSSCVGFNKAAGYPKDAPQNTYWKTRML